MPPSDPMGGSLDYAYKLWPRLRRYAFDGRYHIDNNPVERGQRPSVMGRKNYLFSKSDSGAVDNAIFYSLIERCDVVGGEPLKWLTDVLNNLHDDTPPDQIIRLLPYNYKESREWTRAIFCTYQRRLISDGCVFCMANLIANFAVKKNAMVTPKSDFNGLRTGYQALLSFTGKQYMKIIIDDISFISCAWHPGIGYN